MPEALNARLLAIKQWWLQLSQSIRWTIVAGVSLALAIIIMLAVWALHTRYVVVYAGLNPQEGGAVISALQKGGVAFRLEDSGSIIEVPSVDADRVRLQLAQQGLPAQASSSLWTSLEKEKLGTSSFVEQTTYVRALEATLAHEIASMQGVQSAAVQLAIPRHTPFLQTMPKSKAAVTVRLLQGVILTPQQVFGITHLVSGSVPGLSSTQVTVVDQNGQALTAKNHGASDSRVLRLQELVDRHYRAQIERLLEPLVGSTQNLRVVVNADINFSKAQNSSVTYGIGHAITAAILSEHQKGAMDNAAFGIPGALSNLPPGNPTAPLVAPTSSTASSLSLAEIKAMIPRSAKTDEHFHYLLDKTVAFHKEAPWRLKHLAVSVLVNAQVGGAQAAGTMTSDVPIHVTAQTLSSMQRMVQTALNLAPKLATVDVSALPYYHVVPPVLPWWKRISWPLVWNNVQWFLLALLILFFLRKPLRELSETLQTQRVEKATAKVQKEAAAAAAASAVAAVATATAAASMEAGGSDMMIQATDATLGLDLSGVGEGQLELNMATIQKLIRTDSNRAIQVIREWLGNLGDDDDGND
jgi:flagellar M-ring protein FliF